jgi:SHS2 domain-containing protein
MSKNYEIFEHTADIGISVKVKDLKELFEKAGLSIFEVSSHRQFTKDKTHLNLTIRQKAESLESLFINWLNELISLSAAESLIFHKINVKKIDEGFLEALVTGSSTSNYKVNIEIKAATYHGLRILHNADGYMVEVILDV